MNLTDWNTISHQLVNSIAFIRTNAEILNSSHTFSDREKRVLNRILQCTDSTALYLNDLHLINSLETDSYNEDKEEICILDLFERYPDITFTLPTKIHQFKGYNDLFKRIVKELMDNAMKYSIPGKEIEAKVECKKFYTKISIYNYADPKYQLKEIDILKLGERGYNSSIIPGKGLGMSIVATIVRYLKGDLLIEHDYRGRFMVSVLIPKD